MYRSRQSSSDDAHLSRAWTATSAASGAATSDELGLHQLCHLLAILVGIERATAIARAVLGLLEEGLQESWYERKLRRMHGV